MGLPYLHPFPKKRPAPSTQGSPINVTLKCHTRQPRSRDSALPGLNERKNSGKTAAKRRHLQAEKNLSLKKNRAPGPARETEKGHLARLPIERGNGHSRNVRGFCGARPPCHGGPVPSGARPPPAGRSPVVPGFGPLGLVVVVPCCLACRPCWWWSVVSAGLGGCAAGALRPFGASPPCSWRLWPPCRPWSVVSASVVVGGAPAPVVSGRVARPPGRSSTPPLLCPVGYFVGRSGSPLWPCLRSLAVLSNICSIRG